jgi:cysteine/O-acetylserine efflux protein
MEEQTAFVVFVLVTIFTPGPNTISSANLAILYGFRRTNRYRLGIFIGFTLVMWLCAFLSSAVQTILPSFSLWLRFLGAVYIVYLAIFVLKTSYELDAAENVEFRFPVLKGMLLQILNVKVIILGLTVYSTYLAARLESAAGLLLSALILAAVSLSATSLWALGGSAIAGFAGRRKVRIGLNGLLSLLLLYSAWELSGLGSV